MTVKTKVNSRQVRLISETHAGGVGGNSHAPIQIETWPLDRLVAYARTPRKNDQAVNRMCASIQGGVSGYIDMAFVTPYPIPGFEPL